MKSKNKTREVGMEPAKATTSKTFWDFADKFFDFVGSNTFVYVCLGLVLLGTILGIVANHL